MKTNSKILLISFLLTGVLFGLSSCVSDRGVYYGAHREPWFHDDSWMDGNRGYGEPRGEVSVGVYLHPPRPPRLRR